MEEEAEEEEEKGSEVRVVCGGSSGVLVVVVVVVVCRKYARDGSGLEEGERLTCRPRERVGRYLYSQS